MATMSVKHNDVNGTTFNMFLFLDSSFGNPDEVVFGSSKVTLTERHYQSYYGETLVWDVGGSFTRAADDSISGTVTSLTLSDLGPTGAGPKVQYFNLTGLNTPYQTLIDIWHGGEISGSTLLSGNDTLTGANFVVDPLLPTEGVQLFGEGGNDTITGTAYDDWLSGGAGNDTMTGKAGNDLYRVDSSLDVVVELANQGIDSVKSDVSYTLGNNVENLLLVGYTRLNGTGNTLDNVIKGQAGNNILNGKAGNDTLQGFSGNDTLIGGTGTDMLTGGKGKDIFKFLSANESKTGANRDVITDFISGQDKVNLSVIDANAGTAGINDAFSYITGTSFTAAGQLRFANGILYGNTDADATAEFQIALTGITSMAASDFVL